MKRLQSILLVFFWLLATAAGAEGMWDVKGPKPKKPVEITVYRSPTCQCCARWLLHMQQNGFKVDDRQTDDMDAIKEQFNVPENLKSCHTGVVNGRIVEGHVPAADVLKLLKARPKGVIGLAVPGMPAGTPGMEVGGRKDPFDVIAFDKDGKGKIFHNYGSY